MKNKIGVILILGLLVSLSFANLSYAAFVTVTDTTNFLFDGTGTDPVEDLVSYGGSYVNELEGTFDWVGWTHHFEVPVVEPVSATLTVYLRDDDDGSPGQENTWELGFGIAEDGTWDLGWVNTGDYAYDVTASYLMDGEFTVYVGSLWGNFFIDQSILEMTSNAVPIPSTILIFGSGLVGLIGVRRKIKK